MPKQFYTLVMFIMVFMVDYLRRLKENWDGQPFFLTLVLWCFGVFVNSAWLLPLMLLPLPLRPSGSEGKVPSTLTMPS